MPAATPSAMGTGRNPGGDAASNYAHLRTSEAASACGAAICGPTDRFACGGSIGSKVTRDDAIGPATVILANHYYMDRSANDRIRQTTRIAETLADQPDA